MVQRALLALLVVAVGVLGFVVHAQQRRVAQLEERLESLRELGARARPPSVMRSGLSNASAPPARAARVEPVNAEPRVFVAEDEVARVESAVLRLLESDRPELRSKLQAVVQAEQQALQQRQREQRRERWIARREAKLLQLSETAGVTAEQRDAILTIMLAQRDQVEELRRDAQTPEMIATLKDEIRAVREQTDAQIRKQLTPAQYDAFRKHEEGDDEDGPTVSRERNAPAD